jgi:hypothetical protein
MRHSLRQSLRFSCCPLRWLLSSFALLLPLLGWGQSAVTATHTGTVSAFPTWTYTNVPTTTAGGNDYLQFLTSTSTLVTPTLDFSDFSAEKLDFRARTFNGTGRATISVSVSTDNGASWSAAVTRTPGSSTLTAMTTVDLSAYGGSQVKVRFQSLSASGGIGAGLDDIAITGTALPAKAIITGSIAGAPFCVGQAGAALSVSYSAGSAFAAGTTYTAYVSADGFATKLAIGTGTAAPLAAMLPSSLASGSAYRIRVEGTGVAAPSYTDNGADLGVVNYQTNEVTGYAATAASNRVTLAWTKPTSCFARTVIVASKASVLAAPSGPLTAASTYGSGTALGPDQYVVYSGSGTSTTITGLANETTYYFKAFVTNDDGYSNGQEVSAAPYVPFAATPTTLTLSTVAGATSPAQAYTLAGSSLPADGSIRVTLPVSSGYEISLDNVAFSQALTLAYAGTALSTTAPPTVYVRLAAATAAGSYAKTLTNTILDASGTATASTATVALAGTVGATYTWVGGNTNASWTTATNWSPARTAPTSADALTFAGGIFSANIGTTVVQTIGQLSLSNNATLTIGVNGERTLSVNDGVAGPDFTIEAGSSLILTTTNSVAHGTTVQLGTGATARIAGSLVFTGSGTGTHTLTGSGSPGSIEFVSGSVFTATAKYSGSSNPFGTAAATLGNVVFRNGARYEQSGGSDPFGASQPGSVVVFEPGSYYLYAAAGPPVLAGRTYGTFEYASSSTATATGSAPVTFQGALVLSSGALAINLAGGAAVQGDVLLNGGALAFSPASTANVLFNGTTAQRIGGTGAPGSLTLGPRAVVVLDNAAGLTLAQPISIPGALQLTNGLLTTDATNILTLPASATIAGGSATSFVNGPLARPIDAVSTASAYLFPVGKGGAYRPLTLNITAQTGTTVYRAEQFEGNPGQSLLTPDPNGDLQRVSTVRYYSLTPLNTATPAVVTQPSGFAGTVTLSFGPGDGITDISGAAGLVVAKRSDNAGAWANFGSSAVSGSAASGTLTSGPITSFSDFALGSTNALVAPNPLPVQLTSFAAARTTSGVQVAWATASELNSQYFEVERSLDGRTYARVARLAAQGSTPLAHRYATFDAAAPASLLYYRLRQVDLDGTAHYSPAVAVAGALAELTLAPNPARATLGFLTETPTAYTVRNTLGQVVRTGTTLAGANTLAVEALPAGVYLFELHSGTGGRVVRRFIKE